MLLQNHPFEPMQLVNLEKDPAEENPMPPNTKVGNELIQILMQHIQKSGSIPWQKPPK